MSGRQSFGAKASSYENKNVYVFGYGSLINKNSCLKTLDDVQELIPVRVSGLERSWNVQAFHHSYTAVGVRQVNNENSVCNGVLMKVHQPTQNIPLLDKRERYYSRVELSSKNVMPHANFTFPEEMSDAIIYTYVVNEEKRPCVNFPIAQSYVDTILDGCLSYGHSFAEEFLKNTKGWENVWINERERPLYKKSSYEKTTDGFHLDVLLKQYIPSQLNSRM
eukprot:Nk52_evm4s621 gene=Nk52_evmTU4s621